MNRFGKLAAATLALLLFGTPLVALVNCTHKAALARHCGGEHCPMMRARQHSGAQVSEAPAGDGSCCQMSSLPPSSAKPAVTNEARVSLQPASSQTLVVAPPAVVASAPPVAVLAASPSPQVLLCTFLV